ncbi:low temperature requirement protein A [Leifsonia sp. RAF41]|uniref:low temperature requirement protein A n=1 Tax=Leifsonia sp. RAF41 TaxID=3233056 RepID=UPI003F9D2141
MSQRLPLGPASRDPSRADWMELFFDLIFVALVGQLAHGLHAHPSFAALGVFLALFAAVWWAWANLTFVVDVSPQLTRRGLSAVMLAAMFAVGAMAVAAPEAIGERAWLFAAGNAAIRIVLLVVWMRLSWRDGWPSRLRISSYNGVTAVIWLVSIWVPEPAGYVLWAVAIALEVTLLMTTASRWSSGRFETLNVEHLSERFGLLVIIVLGESVLSIVAEVSEVWTVAGGVVGFLGLLIAAELAWSFFMFGVDVMRAGLERLRAARDVRGIRDTVAFLPYLLLAGVTALSAALAEAIGHPFEPLPLALAVCLGGGIALFYLTNAIITRRYGDPWPLVLRWAAPDVGLALVLVPVAVLLPAMATAASTVVALAIVIALAELSARRRLLAVADS